MNYCFCMVFVLSRIYSFTNLTIRLLTMSYDIAGTRECFTVYMLHC